MKKSLLSLLFIAALAAACGSEVGVDGDAPPTGDDGTTTPGGPGGNGNGNGNPTPGGNADTNPEVDSGLSTLDGGTEDQDASTGKDSGSAVTEDSGSQETDSGSPVDEDSGSTGGEQDSGLPTGDQDAGTGGEQDSGSTGGEVDSGTGGGDVDSGTGGGGSCGHDESCTPHSCTYTQGFYKNHTSSVTALTLGGVSYTQSQVLGFINATPNGDDSIILAKQLIAALLNGGACDCNSATTVQTAQDWMAGNKDADGTLPYGTKCVASTDPGCVAYTLGQTLDAYNNGLSGTPHCQ